MTPGSSLQAVEITARAKINLYLHVIARRPDGYHELDSLVVFAAFGDRLTFLPAEELILECAGPFGKALELADDNLVLKAARLLQSRFAVEHGARIRIEKHLPLAAGLGGGSADAAAALLGMTRLWNLVGGVRELALIAPELGADVAVCLTGRPSFLGGVGERVTLAPPVPELGLVLANPGVPLPTAAVFAGRQGAFSRPARWSGPVDDADALIGLLQGRRNDLTGPASRLVPEIGAVLASLGELPGVLLARMSGSGATCFGLTRTTREAEHAAQTLRGRQPGWWVIASKLDRKGALCSPSAN